ncbi:unnamed protein product, partial [Urochloa humidicola]
RYWTEVSPGSFKRHPNGILGLLCKLHFPGTVVHAGRNEPAYTFDHYVAAEDHPDREHRTCRNKAERVIEEFWDFYRWDEGFEQECKTTARNACYKIVHDMHYEARVQANVTYIGKEEKRNVKKEQVRNLVLTKEQY